MGAYRKKPVVVEAIRNDGTWPPIITWLDTLTPDGHLAIPFGTHPVVTRNADGTLNIETPEGSMLADVGDWVIFDGTERGLYPCKPDAFAFTYEPAEGPTDG